jgi:preprotein translocase subunit YajC
VDQYFSILWIVGLVALMYFMMIRPQRKQQKQRTTMMDNLKKGDKVITAGGIYGIVKGIKDDRVTLEIASEIYVQFTKNAIGSVIRKETKEPARPDPEESKDDDLIDAEIAADSEDAGYSIEQDEYDPEENEK